MDIKKHPKADLENERTTYFLLGLVVVLSLFFVVLEWQTEEYLSADWDGFSRVYIEEELIGFEEVKTDEPIREEQPEVPPAAVKEDFVIVDELDREEVEIQSDSTSAPAIREKEEPLSRLSEEQLQEMIHTQAEVMPEFPGGYNALVRFLFNTMEYPSLAVKQKIEGRVWCSFIVNTDGSVSDIRVEKGVYFALDDEAERVLRLMPPWSPGKIADRNVRVKVYLPVVFKL